MANFSLQTIAVVESCYKQKFAIPRQPGIVPSGQALIRFLPEFSRPEAVEGLELSSHIWLQFVFHAVGRPSVSEGGTWSAKVRPPRLGGNKKIGVFASRSTHRPNSLGLSVVKLEAIDVNKQQVSLQVSGIDLLDGTPILDIKPYIPYADAIKEASNRLAAEAPGYLKVSLTQQVLDQIERAQSGYQINLKTFITEVLQQDPRPAYKQTDERVYAVQLLDFELSWRYRELDSGTEIEVLSLAAI